jgi:hypothetical protein
MQWRRRGDAMARQGMETGVQDLNTKHTLLLIGDQAYILPATVHTFHLNRKTTERPA